MWPFNVLFYGKTTNKNSTNISALSADDMNKRLAKLASYAGVLLPHYFADGTRYNQQHVNENLDVIIEGLENRRI